MNSIEMITFKEPKSPIAEIYRSLRTNIKYTSYKKAVKTIAVTSTYPGEGKSTIIANLGITMSQAGSKILIIDGDLRSPTIHKCFHCINNTGLTNILVENAPYKDCLIHSAINNLDILLTGPKPPNPSEILGSQEMKLLLQKIKEEYDYVLIDTPPIVVVTDAALIASICEGVLFVVASGVAVVEDAVKAKELLQNVNANILGVVLNKVKTNKSMEYYGYNYYSSFNAEKKSFRRSKSKR